MFTWAEKRWVALTAFALSASALVVSLILQVMAGIVGIPIRGFDDIMYTTPILYYANTGQLVNPFVQFGDTTKFMWHGWLTPVLIGSLPGAGDPTLVGVTMVALAFLAVILFALLVFRRGLTWEGALLLPALFVAQLYNTNRPELVSTLLLVTAMLVLLPLWKREPFFSIGFALAMALVAVAHPHAAFLGCFAFGLVLVARAPNWRWLILHALGYSAAIVALIVLMTELNPLLTFIEWFGGLFGMATKISGMEANAQFAFYYIKSPLALLMITYLGAIAISAAWIVQNSKSDDGMPGRRITLYAGIVIFCILIWALCIRTPHLTYILSLAGPLLWAVHQVARDPRNPLQLLARLLILVIGVSAAISLAYRGVSTELSRLNGISSVQYRSEIAMLAGEAGRIGTNISMVNETVRALPGLRIEPWPRFDMFPPTRHAPDFGTPPPVMIIAQANSSTPGAPLPPSGYDIVVDRFHRDAPSLLGLRVGNTYKDFGYAILCRQDYCPALKARLIARPNLTS